MVVLGAHDLNSVESQRVTIKAVYSQASDGSFPPLHDLALLHLSVAARRGTRLHPRHRIPTLDLVFCLLEGLHFN